MKRALVTGSHGFVGRHFCRHLLDAGWTVTPVDIRSPKPASRMDVRDFFRTFDVRYDLVVHLAAVVGGRTMIEGSPLQLAAEDLSIDAEMWRWALRTKPGRIVYYSSSAAYPVDIQNRGPLLRRWLHESDIDLDDVAQPDQSYGWVKLTGEHLAHHAGQLGLTVHVFRPFSGYGADQDKAYPFPALIERAKRREDPFHVWGTGEQVRDWIHIDDVVAATVAAVNADVRGPVNLCTGRGTTFLDLARRIIGAAGYEPKIVPLPDKPAGVLYRVGDPTFMHTFYTPRITLEEGIQQALGG